MDVLNHLRDLIHRLNRHDIRSVQALSKKVTGDQAAAVMLMRLLYWLPKSRSGWVYKSWRDWEAECGLSRAQVKRVHSKGLLKAIGVERKLMKACGAPTMHYRINIEVLYERIATCLNVKPEMIVSNEELVYGQGENSPVDRAEADLCTEREQTNPLSGSEPIHRAETNKDSQQRQTTEQHNRLLLLIRTPSPD
jgi:hypothetical protein